MNASDPKAVYYAIPKDEKLGGSDHHEHGGFDINKSEAGSSVHNSFTS